MFIKDTNSVTGDGDVIYFDPTDGIILYLIAIIQ